MFTIGIDPGRDGGIVVLDPDGELFFSAVLPYKDKQTDHVELARIYSEIDMHVKASNFDSKKIYCFIEKIFTRPEDNGSEEYLKALEGVCVALRGVLDEATTIGDKEGPFPLTITREHYNLLQERLTTARKFYRVRDRRDGRVGTMNYAKSAGTLFMGAVLGWDIVEVSPRTWGAVIKRGLEGESKDKSIDAVRRIDARLLEQPSPLFKSSRARVVHMGLLEAFLIAKWGRIDLGLDVVGEAGKV